MTATTPRKAPLDDIAPYPRTEQDATADALIKHYAAFGLMHSHIALNTASTTDPQFRTSVAYMASSFTTVYLLRELAKRSEPADVDAVARDLWSHHNGGETSEWLWEWLAEYGIDPAPIEGIAAEVEQRIRAKAGAR